MNKESKLLVACYKGDVDNVRHLLNNSLFTNRVDVNTKDTKAGITPLILASKGGYKQIAEILISKGAVENQKDDSGYTALMWASKEGHQEVAELLLENGADVNAKSKNGNTALFYASEKGRVDLVELLISKGADVNAKNNNSYTPLMYASHVLIADMLITNGADVNATSNDGYTPFLCANTNGYEEIATLLISSGASLDNTSQKRIKNKLHDSKAGQNEPEIETNGQDISVVEQIEPSTLETHKKDTTWLVEVQPQEGDFDYYNRRTFIDQMRNNILEGNYTMDTPVTVFVKPENGIWSSTNYTIKQFSRQHHKLDLLFRPIREHASKGLYWGAVTGVFLKLLDTTITLASVDPALALFFVVAIAVCFIPRIGFVGMMVIGFLLMKNFEVNFFLMAFVAAFTGGILGSLPGMGIGGLIGCIRRNNLPLAKDVKPEPGYYLFTIGFLPLLAGIGLIIFYLLIFNPWLIEQLK